MHRIIVLITHWSGVVKQVPIHLIEVTDTDTFKTELQFVQVIAWICMQLKNNYMSNSRVIARGEAEWNFDCYEYNYSACDWLLITQHDL